MEGDHLFKVVSCSKAGSKNHLDITSGALWDVSSA